MLFKEGVNKRGLLVFVGIIIILIIVLSWYISDVNNITKVGIAIPNNYEAIIKYPNQQYTIYRVINNIKISSDNENFFYIDLESGQTAIYNKSTSDAKYMNYNNDQLLLFDPYNLADFTISHIHAKNITPQSNTEYLITLKNQEFSVILNDRFLPTKLMAANGIDYINYEYSTLDSLILTDVVLPLNDEAEN